MTNDPGPESESHDEDSGPATGPTDDESGPTAGSADDGASGGPQQSTQPLDRLWNEIKGVYRQIEDETRRGGQIARLRYELHGLRRKLRDISAELGAHVHDAHSAAGSPPDLAELAGYDDLVARLDDLLEQAAAKEQEIRERGGDVEPTARARKGAESVQ